MEIAKAHNMKFTINVLSGTVKVNNKKENIFCIKDYESVYFSENSILQLMVVGNLASFISDLRKLVDFTAIS